jgi:hydroxymethylpyrimidine pyrophosphatase-like HAD family hydrolase
VLYTGAVVTGREWHVLHRDSLGTDNVRQIVDRLSRGDRIAVYGTMPGDRDIRFSSTIPHETASPVLKDFRDMDPFSIPGHEFIGVPVRVPDNERLKLGIRDWISETLDVGRVVNQNFVDIVPAGASKGAVLRWSCSPSGIPGMTCRCMRSPTGHSPSPGRPPRCRSRPRRSSTRLPGKLPRLL